ncbi:MAG: hypothetical protein RIE52_11865 [Balneola sp.]
MSLSGVTTISKVKFVVAAASKEYFVDKVVLRKSTVGEVRRLGDGTNSFRKRFQYLIGTISAQDVEQDSGTSLGFRALQLDIEDSSVTVAFYPDASQSENYNIVPVSFRDQSWYETEYDARVDGDSLTFITEDSLTDTQLEWYKKYG